MQNAIAGMNGKMLESYEGKGEEESCWRFSDSAKNMLNGCEDDLKTELSRQKYFSGFSEDMSGLLSQLLKIDYELPQTKERLKSFKKDQEECCSKVEAYLNLNDVPLADEIREELSELISFEPEYNDDGNVTNSENFKAIMESLNELLDTSWDTAGRMLYGKQKNKNVETKDGYGGQNT